jgi:hypothetical protein
MSYPWFKCYADDFLSGLADLSIDEQAFYVQLVFRMYDAADAIYVDDKRIARWCNSNARKWNRVKEALIDAGKLTILPDGGLINRRALREMIKNSDRVPQTVRGRLENLSQLFEQTLGKDFQKFRETSPEKPKKTEPSKEPRDQKPDEGMGAREVLDALMNAAGLSEAELMTRPGLVSPVEMLHLMNPTQGQPCDLQLDIVPAVQRCAAHLKAKNDTLKSWSYCREAAIRNRDQRLAPAPDVQQRPANGPPRQSSNPALRVLAGLQEASRGQDDHGGVLFDGEGDVIEHGDLAPARFG